MCHLFSLLLFGLVGGVGQERYVARPLDGFGQHALVRSASPADAARQNLTALRNKALKQLHVFVINEVNFFATEAADLTAMHATASATAPASISATVAVTVTSTAAALAVIKAAIHII
jgi:hypothetical protein